MKRCERIGGGGDGNCDGIVLYLAMMVVTRTYAFVQTNCTLQKGKF